MQTIKLFIDGVWRDGSGGGEDIVNPATGTASGQVAHATQADLDEALHAAKRGFEVWRKTSAYDRSAVLRRAKPRTSAAVRSRNRA